MIPLLATLGARGFSCAVSGFGQAGRSSLHRSCLRPSAEHVSACGRRNEVPCRTREKTSGTQGTFWRAHAKKKEKKRLHLESRS